VSTAEPPEESVPEWVSSVPPPAVTDEPALPPAPSGADTRNRQAAIVATGSGLLLLVASFLRWDVVRFDGTTIDALSPTGWAAGDGKITVLVGAGAVLVAALLWLGRREGWLKLGLIAGGGVALAVAAFNYVDYTSGGKPAEVADSLGLTPDGISSSAGAGVQLAIIASVGLIGAGLMVRHQPRQRRER
jgi:hypothetical protein